MKLSLPKLILLIIFCIAPISESDAQSVNDFKKINNVWKKFYKAFETLDYTFMAEIHSKELIRIAGGKNISDYETYINNYKRRFKEAKTKNISNDISLRFFERIHNDSVASERGIYKLTRTENGKNKQSYYGQFHVLFKKEKGTWKIIMDYDSSEGNTIGEKEYLKAIPLENIEAFLKG